MNLKLSLLVKSLRQLEKAYDKLSRGVPDPNSAAANADRALENVLKLLADRELADNLNSLIVETRKTLGAHDAEVNDEQRRRRLEQETKVLRDSGLSPNEIAELYFAFQNAKSEQEKFVSSSEELRAHLENLHQKYKSEIAASREQPRKAKKRRKRRVLQGAVTTTIGTTALVADTFFPPLFAFSYGMGGSALLLALRDFIGDPAE